jgi:hypothetical protein
MAARVGRAHLISAFAWNQGDQLRPANGLTVGEGIYGGPGRTPDEEEWFMKTRLLTVFALVALAVVLVYTVSTPAAPHKANSNAVPTANAQPNTAATPAAEPHPEIREAIAALRRAKGHMEHAAHDFGGHRVEALRATDEAIHQLEDCLKFDKD